MRRVIIAITLSLLLGLLTSIAIAWSIALTSEPIEYHERITDKWIGGVSAEPLFTSLSIRHLTRLYYNSPVTGYDQNIPSPFAKLINEPPSSNYIAAQALMTGLPFPCLYYTRTLGRVALVEDWDYENHGSIRGFDPFTDVTDPDAEIMYLPIKPYWPGLAANTFILSVAWMILLGVCYSLRCLRAANRKHKNQCAFCKYELHREMDRCSECGRLRSQRQQFVGSTMIVAYGVVAILITSGLVGYTLTFHARDPVPPIIRASYEGDAARVQQLLDTGADPNYLCSTTYNSMFSMTFTMMPIVAASVSGDVSTVRALLEAGADPNDIHDVLFPVGVAVENGHFDVADLLIELGADPNAGASRRITVLSSPVLGGNVPAIQYLIDHGVNPSNAERIMMAAVLARNDDVFDLLLDHGANPEAGMRAAVRQGGWKYLQQLVECGADPLQRSDFGSTLLGLMQDQHYNEQVYDFLLEAGVDINAVDSTGRTALMEVAMGGNPRCTFYLLEHGADPNVVDAGNTTALREAIADAVSVGFYFFQGEADLSIMYLLAFHADPTLIPENELNALRQPMRDVFTNVRQQWINFDSTNTP